MSTAPAPASSTRKSILCRPMPCSPVQVPSIASARCTSCCVEPLGGLALARVVRVDQVGDVEVAVADVADDVVRHARWPRPRPPIRRTHSARREIGTQASVVTVRQPGFDLQAGEVGVVARRPQPRALLGRASPTRSPRRRARCAISCTVSACSCDAGRRCRGTPSAASAPRAAPSLSWRLTARTALRVEQLAARDRHAQLDDLDRGAHRRVDAREASRSPPTSPRAADRAQRDLGHHAERAFAADEQPRQVVAGRRLPARACRCGSPRRWP